MRPAGLDGTKVHGFTVLGRRAGMGHHFLEKIQGYALSHLAKTELLALLEEVSHPARFVNS